jgi:hypothetical protein
MDHQHRVGVSLAASTAKHFSRNLRLMKYFKNNSEFRNLAQSHIAAVP